MTIDGSMFAVQSLWQNQFRQPAILFLSLMSVFSRSFVMLFSLELFHKSRAIKTQSQIKVAIMSKLH